MTSQLINKRSQIDQIQRIALSLQYEGTSYCGWQRQSKDMSVQEVLENAISKLDPYRPIKAVAAGRTDSGVHAAGQVVHFDCSGPIPSSRWAAALNGVLPASIRVREAVLRPNNWHACHSAIYRRYRYLIFNACKPNLFLSPWSWHRYRYRLDDQLMSKALEGLLGRHDFSAFQRTRSQRIDAVTTVQEINLERNGDLIVLEIQASGFLYGMVRLLVGQLVALGEHRMSLKAFERRWKEGRRSEVREAAPAKGLCLVRAGYEEFIFSEPAWYDSFPKYSLAVLDSPKDPPII